MKRLFLTLILLFSCKVIAYSLDKFLYLEFSTSTCGTVTSVIDGDTIEVELSGSPTIVRLLSIDTPELPNEPFALEAKDFASQLLNQTIELYYSSNTTYQYDKYNRLLAVVVHNGEIFNIKLLQEGLARRMFIFNDIIKFTAWEDEEVKARKEELNIWSYINSNRIFINEINVNPYPEADSEAEFVELYNDNDSQIDIGSWTFLSSTETVMAQGTIISPHGYLIIARTNPTRFREIYPNTPEGAIIINVENTLILSNSYNPPQGLAIYLKGNDGSYQDALTYNLEWDGENANETGRTIERKSIYRKNVGDSKGGGEDDLNWNPSRRAKGSHGRANLHALIDKLNPQSGYINDVITIEGSGFDDCEDIEIDFGTTINIAGTKTSNGQFTKAFNIDLQEEGSVVITARGLTSLEVATTTFFLKRVIIELLKSNEPFSDSESNLAKTMITSLPDLVGDISIVPDTDVVFPGWKILFIINYKNIGSTTAGTTTIHIDEDKENLKDIVAFNNGYYDPANSIEWTIGSIPPGRGGSVTFMATVVGVPGDTITVTGFLENGFRLDLSLILSLQSEFSSEWYDWLMANYGLGRTGYNDGTEDFYPPFGEKWRRFISGKNDDIRSSPAILKSALYTGGLGDLPEGGSFYRLNAEDGSVVWKFNTNGEIHSSPCIANNGQYVYVGNADGRFYCFSATETTPTLIWTFDTMGGEIYSSPVVWKGLVYFTAKRQQTGYVYCLSAINGAPCWIKPLNGQFFYSSPCISEEDNLVYVGDDNGVLWALDALLGSITWSYNVGSGSPISSSPIYKNGIVYISTCNGIVYAVSAKTGSLLWSYNPGSSSIKATGALADNTLFFGADDGYIYALNILGSPTLKWSYKTQGPVKSSPAIASDLVYVSSSDGYIYALDIKGGTPTWSYKIGNYSLSSPAIARRMIYVISGDGNVYCFERKPNFSLSKLSLQKAINVGSTLTYTLSFKNTGYVGSGVYVVDSIPPYLGTPSVSLITFGSFTYYPSTRTLRWEIGTVSTQDYGTLTFNCLVEAEAPRTITNTATLYSNEIPPISTFTETALNYLSLKKSVDLTVCEPGGTLTYLIEYKSPYLDLNDFVIEDVLPSSLTYISGSAKGEGMTILYSHNGTWNEFDYEPVSSIKWTRGPLEGGRGGTVSFKVVVDGEVSEGIITNIATSCATGDGGFLFSTSTASATTHILSEPLLALSKTIDMKNSYPYPSGTLTYILEYTNERKQATNVEIIDFLPTETTYLSHIAHGTIVWYSHDGINYDQNPIQPIKHIKWIIESLERQAKGSITLVLRIKDNINPGTIIINTSRITSNEITTPIQAQATTYIATEADLSQSTITSTPKGTVSAGWFITYAINYKNTGNIAALDVVVKVSLDNNLAIYKIENGTISNGYILFDLGTIGAGEEGIMRFSCFVKKPILSPSRIIVSASIKGSNIGDVNISSSIPLDLPINSESDEWPMLGFNPPHVGYNPKEFIMAQKLGLVGSISIDGQIFGQPIINNNRIYIVSGSGGLHAFDEKGKSLWTYPAKIYSTPAIFGNNIFITTEDGYLNCLSEQGVCLFSSYIGPALSSPAIVNSILYVASQKAIYGISAFDGEVLWSYSNINGDIYSSPAISNDLLYIGTHRGNIYIIDALTGVLKASFNLPSKLYSSIVIDRDIAYCGGRDGIVYGIKIEEATTTTTLNVNLGSPIDAMPAIYNNTLYIGLDNGRLYAIDLGAPDVGTEGATSTSSSIKWTFPTGGRIKSQCAIANALFFTSEDGYLYCLSLDDGKILFSYEIGIGRGVSLANGSVYAVSQNKLWIFGNAPSLAMSILSSSADFIIQGETITYKIKYENNGNEDAIGTKIIAYLENLKSPFDISHSGIYADGTITWILGTISQGSYGELTFKAKTFAARATEVCVYGEIMADNNPVYKAGPIKNRVGLPFTPFLTITAPIATATINEEITYNILYGNVGDLPGYNLYLRAKKPDFTTYISHSTWSNQNPLTDINGLSPIFSGIEITEMSPITSSSITFKLKITLDCPQGYILPQEVTLSGNGQTQTQTYYILIEKPELCGSETVYPNLVVGDPAVYTIYYQNRGRRTCYGTIIYEKLSPQIATVSSISKNGMYDPIYHTIRWDVGKVEINKIGSVTFNANSKSVLDNGLIIMNNVYFEATNIPLFEVQGATLTIKSNPNLRYSTKDVIPKGEVSIGSVVKYNINVVNSGNMDANDVVIEDKLPSSLSVSQIRTKGEVVSGDGNLDIDDINGWLGFGNQIPDGIIEITTNDGKYRSYPINTFNYPTILSLMTEINNDTKAKAKISYDPIFDKFTISKEDGCIMSLYEEGNYPFFSAIKIEAQQYCTGSFSQETIMWNMGTIPGYSSKTISFSAQIIDSGSIINYATITSSNHPTTITNLAIITIDKDPPSLVGRPMEDSSDFGVDYDLIDDDADTDGRFRIIFPIESEPCGLIEYEIAEKQGTLSWKTIATASSNAQYYEVLNRRKGLTYRYKVRGRNAAGFGAWSDSSDGIRIVDGGKVISPDRDATISHNGIIINILKDTFKGTITFTIRRKIENEITAFSPLISSILPDSTYELIAMPEEYSEEGTQPLKPFILVLPYKDPDLNNEIDDLSYRIYKLIGNKWALVDGPQIVSPTNDTVQCTLNSLSIYAIGDCVELPIQGVVIKPNPFKINKHNTIIFEGLPGNVIISIYNMAGELVFKGEHNGPKWEWNLLNEKGEKLSSGVYFALIDSGNGKVVRRFAIIK